MFEMIEIGDGLDFLTERATPSVGWSRQQEGAFAQVVAALRSVASAPRLTPDGRRTVATAYERLCAVFPLLEPADRYSDLGVVRSLVARVLGDTSADS
jgi:hypothetical protein